MPTYKIRGIDVDFPFEAYDCQLVYMDKVIQSLQSKCNALLESPTGTGKTLCLLCATLAWRKSLAPFSTGKIERNGRTAGSKSDDLPSDSDSGGSGLPTIIYTSRTHSQLRQVIQELKRSTYRPKMVVLGSREQLCIHDEVSLLRGKAQTNACHFVCRKRGKRQCTHHTRVSDYVRHNPHLGDEPIDIEDLVNIGRKFGPCPYYVSRELQKVVDILFAPYNYLIDRGNRRSLKVDWDNSILIFDEAHNLESLCADAASFDLSSGLLTACIAEAKSCIDLSVVRREKSNDKSQNPDNFAILKAILLKLEKRIAEVPIGSKELGFTKPGPYIYELLADLNITYDTASKLTDIIEQAAMLLEEDKQLREKGALSKLESIGDILKIIFRDKHNAHADSYRVHVQDIEAGVSDSVKGKASRTLSWWCFNPGVAMEEFSNMGVGSIILTSGTLSPMDSFAHELKLNFPIRLENPHVISSNQIWAGVVTVGPSGRSFNSSYRNRDSLEYKQELGNAVVNFARLVPDGLLVFFPSYYLLDQCIECWKNVSHANSTTIWERICKLKKPVVEPRQSSLFPSAIEDYMGKLNDRSTSGAVFFAVCRGKVSEGLDFADHAGRAVMVIGMPFASRNDPKVRLKREFLDEQLCLQRGACKILTGEEWYTQQASRAVNQAVGRVIRHRHDYGAIIFCDERFANLNSQSQISRWIQPHIKCYGKFGDVVFTLSRFFRDGGVCCPVKLKSVESNDNENVREVKISQPMDKFNPEIFLSTGTASADKNCSVKSFSSLLEDRRGKDPRKLEEVLPANRLSLFAFKEDMDFKLKSSDHLINNEKTLRIHGRKNMQHQKRDVIDLMGQSFLVDIPSTEALLVPYPGKKRKGLKIEHNLIGQEHASTAKRLHLNSPCSNFSSVMEPNNPLTSDNGMRTNVQIGSAFPCKDQVVTLQGDVELLTQKNKSVQTTLVPCENEEKKGSAFLIQVKEKLTASEYKEFVGFMKAMKSKAMKMGNILESIVRLFSGPDRFPLLKRFKDYIPGKYHSMYDHYLEANDEEINNQT